MVVISFGFLRKRIRFLYLEQLLEMNLRKFDDKMFKFMLSMLLVEFRYFKCIMYYNIMK